MAGAEQVAQKAAASHLGVAMQKHCPQVCLGHSEVATMVVLRDAEADTYAFLRHQKNRRHRHLHKVVGTSAGHVYHEACWYVQHDRCTRPLVPNFSMISSALISVPSSRGYALLACSHESDNELIRSC